MIVFSVDLNVWDAFVILEGIHELEKQGRLGAEIAALKQKITDASKHSRSVPK
jgi:hypothetical protein